MFSESELKNYLEYKEELKNRERERNKINYQKRKLEKMYENNNSPNYNKIIRQEPSLFSKTSNQITNIEDQKAKKVKYDIQSGHVKDENEKNVFNHIKQKFGSPKPITQSTPKNATEKSYSHSRSIEKHVIRSRKELYYDSTTKKSTPIFLDSSSSRSSSHSKGSRSSSSRTSFLSRSNKSLSSKGSVSTESKSRRNQSRDLTEKINHDVFENLKVLFC